MRADTNVAMATRWFRDELDAGFPAPVALAVDDGGRLCAAAFVGAGKDSLEQLAAKAGATLEPAREPSGAARALAAYARGAVDHPEVELTPHGTAFQRRVWAAVQQVGAGETATYAEIARRIGNESAVRAVGAANGQNPIPIFIPCHRIVGSDGSLTGYAGGLPIKRFLLAHEQRQGELFGGVA